MKPKKLLPIVAGTIVTIGLLVPVTYLMYQRLVYGGCNRHLEPSLMGPNGLHEARVLLETCSNGSFITVTSSIVQIVHAGKNATDTNDILSYEPDDTPVTKWLGPMELEIVIPKYSRIGLQRSSFENVNLKVSRSTQ